MNQGQVLDTLVELGALVEGSHIVYTHGDHGTSYINKDAIYPHTEVVSDLCRSLALSFEEDEVQVVLAPALGGIILSQWVAHHLTQAGYTQVLGIYAEKDEGDLGFALRRGYDKLIPGKRILVVEDVLTTGGSAKKVIKLTRLLGGEVVGLGVLCNRGGITTQDVDNVPKLISLANVSLQSWSESECPMCQQGLPINTTVGKGREYLARKELKS